MRTKRKERVLGKAEGKRQYDLPLNKGEGAGFLTLLIGLMMYLAVLALAASFALSAMTARWSTGLENSVTIEIPAESADGSIMSHEEIKTLTTQVAGMLENNVAVKDVHILSDEELIELVQPWLGADLLLNNIPVPGLISVTLTNNEDGTPAFIEKRVQEIAPRGRVDTHEAWLKDLLRFTGALQMAAALLTIVIGATTATAVAGAVRARMAVHNEEVQLLHLMGAADRYIARQFQRHSLILSMQGGAAGMVAGILTLLLIGWVSGEMEVNLLPDFHLSFMQIIALLCLPAVGGAIAAGTAGHTVYRVLAKLP